MEYMGTKEAAEKWGYTQATIRKWFNNGEIWLMVKPEKVSGRWRIPKEAECPRKIRNCWMQ